MLCLEVPPCSPRARAWETLAAQFPIPGLNAVPTLTASVPGRPSGAAWTPGGQTLLTLGPQAPPAPGHPRGSCARSWGLAPHL